MAVRQGSRGRLVRWRPLMFWIVLGLTLSLGGCLGSFTGVTNQPPTANQERGGKRGGDDWPTPQLFDFSLNFSDA